jgi:putative mRNA 3-end processing factor
VRQARRVAGNDLDLVADDAGLCLRALGLWLDPVRPTPPSAAAFVSHAHAAAAAACDRVIASRETLALSRALATSRAPGPTPGSTVAMSWHETIAWPVDAAHGGGEALLSIAPAGHMLGAAQLVVEYAGRRLVYTGDFSPEADGTHPRGVPQRCDELIVTSAFSLPIFRFEPRTQTLAAIVEYCADRLSREVVPVVLAQNPGPAQSIVRELLARGVPVAAPDDVRRGAEAYEELGVAIGAIAPHEAGMREAAVVASAATRAAAYRGGGTGGRRRTEVAYASGWAMLDAAVEQKRADAAFVLGDQADHDSTLAWIRGCGAAVVHVSRGDARALAHVLRLAGGEADAIELPPIDDRGAS